MSTAATKAELFTQAGKAAFVLENFEDYLGVNSENLIGNLDDFEQALEGDYNQEKLAGVAALRGALGNALSPAVVRGIFSPILRDLMKAIGRDTPFATDQQRFNTLHDYMVENSETIQEDQYSLGSVSADGSNTGNGTILVLTVDENGEALQGLHVDDKRIECTGDQNSPGVVEHEEVFTFTGEPRSVDWAEVTGSNGSPLARGRVPNTFSALSARASTTWVVNPSFGTFTGSTGAGNLTDLTNWTVAGTITSTLEIDTADYYRDYLGEGGGTPASVVFTADETISQIVKDVAGGSYDDNTPYWTQIAVKPTTGTSGGNVILRCGAITRTVALTSLTANQWNVVGILSSPGANCWPANFREADLTISVEIENLAGGSGVKVDDLVHGPMTQFDGLWYVGVPVAASNTTWKRGDFFTKTSNSVSSRGILQYWFGFRTGWGYLPSATSTPTYSDPS